MVICVLMIVFVCFYLNSRRKTVSIAMHEQILDIVSNRQFKLSLIVQLFNHQNCILIYRRTREGILDLPVDGNTALVSKFHLYVLNDRYKDKAFQCYYIYLMCCTILYYTIHAAYTCTIKHITICVETCIALYIVMIAMHYTTLDCYNNYWHCSNNYSLARLYQQNFEHI